jgi:uncharacterized OB-fold protein
MGRSERVMGFCDAPMWDSIERGAMALQCCAGCGAFRYPPAPICAACLSMQAEWRPLAGTGTVVSWVTFHRSYFDDFPAPYHAMAVRLDEGPLIVTNPAGPLPEGSWIGRRVRLDYVLHDGRRQHAARFLDPAAGG